MTATSKAIVFRVSYTRPSRKPEVKPYTRYRLFNSKVAATNYIARLHQPNTEKTPERFRGLPPIEDLRLDAGFVCWEEEPYELPAKAAFEPATRTPTPEEGAAEARKRAARQGIPVLDAMQQLADEDWKVPA